MIDVFKINTKETCKTAAISGDMNCMFYHALNKKSAIVQTINCDDNKFFHVVDKWLMKAEETEIPVYNMVLDLENINLDELTLEIKKNVMNTDCVVCEFDKFPFKLDDNNDVIDYYRDQEQIVHNYKLDEGSKRVKHSKLQRYI